MDDTTRDKIIKTLEELPIKYDGPKFDAHVHVMELKDKGIENLVKYREEFNIKKGVAIIWGNNNELIEKEFPNKFIFAKYFMNQDIYTGNPNSQSLVDDIVNIHRLGFPIVKFWLAPGYRDYFLRLTKKEPKTIKLSDESFKPMFSKIEELGLILLIHVSDPDIFYEKVYQPSDKYGKKPDHLNDLENILKRHPKLKVQGAHFGAQAEPENLDNIGRWFDTYPNYNVDMSSARWMAREFGRDIKKAREFLIKYSDRIMYATDLVQNREQPVSIYYRTRYLTFKALLETDARNIPLPFNDKENDNNTVINGLDLPLDVLKKIYWENAKRIFQF